MPKVSRVIQLTGQVLPTLDTPPDIALIVRRAGVTSIVASILATKKRKKFQWCQKGSPPPPLPRS